MKVPITVSIDVECKKWVKEHPYVSASQILNKAIIKMIKNE